MSQLTRDKLFNIYRDRLSVQDIAFSYLRKEFDSMMLLKYDYMPYWFVCKLIEMGIDINDKELPF